MSAKIENGVLYINGLKVPFEHPINNFVEIDGQNGGLKANLQDLGKARDSEEGSWQIYRGV